MSELIIGRSMIDFNVDYIANTLGKTMKVQRVKGMNQLNVTEFVINAQALQMRKRILALHLSFTRILVARRPHPEYLLSIQPMIKRKQEQAFLMIKRFCALSDRSGQIKADQKLNYPFAIIKKVLSQVEKKRYEAGFDCIRKYARFNKQIQIRLQRVSNLVYEYQKRIYLIELFTIGKKKFTQLASFKENSDQLVNVLVSSLKRKYEWAFGHLSVRLMTIEFLKADKQKLTKREEATKGGQKRNEIVNELKKKITTLKGQSHEGKIQNNKRKTDGSRQNGTKMMKKTQQLRNLQTNISQTSNQIARLEQQILRKKAFISGRPAPAIKFEQMQQLYNWANESDRIQWKEVQVKAGQSVKPNINLWIVQQNVILKQLINIHERVEIGKKSDAYANADNQNTSLKGVIGSLIRSQYFETRRQKMMTAVKEVETQIIDFKQDMSAARFQNIEIKQ